MTLEVGDQVVCKYAGNNGECATVKVVGIANDIQSTTYIMATRLGTFFQVRAHKACICNNIDSCNLKEYSSTAG